jgi:hypothetical protein
MYGVSLNFGQNADGTDPQVKQRRQNTEPVYDAVHTACQFSLGGDYFSGNVLINGFTGFFGHHRPFVHKLTKSLFWSPCTLMTRCGRIVKKGRDVARPFSFIWALMPRES